MRAQPFGRKYAAYYDALYADKDYFSEAWAVRSLLKTAAPRASTLLELGCGTGNYTKIVSGEYKVTAIEKSPHMLRIARNKLGSVNTAFFLGDAVKVLPRLRAKFDSCVALFHVVNYLRTKRELGALLREVHSHLEDRGVFIFDTWNGSAVIQQRPTVRMKKVERGKETIIRIAQPRLMTSSRSCDVLYTLFVIRGQRLVASFRENHRMRYYFPNELRALLKRSGFRTVEMRGYERETPLRDSWSMLVLARRV